MDQAPYPTIRVLAAMVRADDDKAVKYVLHMLSEKFGNVVHAAEAIGCSERVIYEWADANARIKAALDKARGGRPLRGRTPLRGAALEKAIAQREARRRRRRKSKAA